jgi:hypothetical protein
VTPESRNIERSADRTESARYHVNHVNHVKVCMGSVNVRQRDKGSMMRLTLIVISYELGCAVDQRTGSLGTMLKSQCAVMRLGEEDLRM